MTMMLIGMMVVLMVLMMLMTVMVVEVVEETCGNKDDGASCDGVGDNDGGDDVGESSLIMLTVCCVPQIVQSSW